MKKASLSISVIAATIDSNKSAGFKSSFLSWWPDDLIEKSALKTGSSPTKFSRMVPDPPRDGKLDIIKVIM
jgi:hypothetical protein